MLDVASLSHDFWVLLVQCVVYGGGGIESASVLVVATRPLVAIQDSSSFGTRNGPIWLYLEREAPKVKFERKIWCKGRAWINWDEQAVANKQSRTKVRFAELG